jgi:ATP-dependent DNA helicase RecG
MNAKAIQQIIAKGEGISVEFKTATFELPRNVFETVCAFLNRQGGHLLLGVTDNGKVEGVIQDTAQDMKDAFAKNMNNRQVMKPTYYVLLDDVLIDGKTVLHAYIPESSQVHAYKNNVFDRNEDGDFNITDNPDLVRQLHVRKHGNFSENVIYPYITITDLREDLIKRVRVLANNYRPNHPWMELSDVELLRSANLWKRDFKTGEDGYTLAAALLFGKDNVIRNILPYYKTDAIVRKVNTDRYDDREIIQTNLIESYDKLMAFVGKHLSDKFHIEGDQRVSLRDKIFREVIANTLIHREFMNEYPAKFIIENERVLSENWNRSHGNGNLVLNEFTPFPKNPVIAAFFREIGRADELGSGMRNTSKYVTQYTKGKHPEFIEGDVFKIIIPIAEPSGNTIMENDGAIEGTVEGVIEGVIEGVTKTVKQKLVIVIQAIQANEGKRLPDYEKTTSLKEKSLERYIKQLRDADLIEFQGDAPKTGGYYLTKTLKEKLTPKSY